MRIINTSTLTTTTSLSRNENDWVYNGLDCCVTMEILDVLLQQLDPVARKTYKFSLALQNPVLEMGLRGVRVNNKRRQEVLTKYKNQIEQLSRCQKVKSVERSEESSVIRCQYAMGE